MASSLRTPDSPPKLGRQPSYIHFTPRRAMASFENLVVLANYEEHLREARKVVWRDRGEPPVELQDLGECFEHACRGGLRTSRHISIYATLVNTMSNRVGNARVCYTLGRKSHLVVDEDQADTQVSGRSAL